MVNNSHGEQERVFEEPQRKRSILELQGLGAEIWKGVDVTEYINRERDSWDAKPSHTITEFKGIAKGFWANIDIQKYIEDERSSWERE